MAFCRIHQIILIFYISHTNIAGLFVFFVPDILRTVNPGMHVASENCKEFGTSYTATTGKSGHKLSFQNYVISQKCQYTHHENLDMDNMTIGLL